MPKQTKREDLLLKRVGLDLSKRHHIDGVIVQAYERADGQVDIHVKVDSTGELRWFHLKPKVEKPVMPNAPKEQTCGICGRRAKRIAKTERMATYRCSAGHKEIISLKGVANAQSTG